MKSRRFRIQKNESSCLGQSDYYDQNQLQKDAKEIGIKNQFLYIDINEESGYRLMKACESSDEEEEIEHIGKKVKVNLNDLQTPNAKALAFLHKMRQSSKKKEKVMNIINQEINKKIDKHVKLESLEMTHSTRYIFRRNPQLVKSKSKAKDKKKFREEDDGIFSLLGRSITADLHELQRFQTLQTGRYSERLKSPKEKAEKYLQRVKLILPSLHNRRSEGM